MENFVFPDEMKTNLKCMILWTFFLFWLEFRKKAAICHFLFSLNKQLKKTFTFWTGVARQMH